MSDLVLSRDSSSEGLKKGGVILNWSPSGTSQQVHYTTKKSSDKKFYVIDVQDDVSTYHFNRPELSLSEVYLFKVVSSSAKSNTLEVSFLSDRPDKPAITSVVSMDNALKFKMQMGSLNGSVVNSINFFLSNGNEIFSVERALNSLNEYTLDADDGISNYEEYEIASLVSTNRGASQLSDGVVSKASDYPNVPQNVTVDESDKSALLQWAKPSDFSLWQDSFVAIHIWYKEMSESTFTEILNTHDKHATGHQLLGLTNGVNYHFQVAYENEYGITEHTVKSSLVSFSPFGMPSAPLVINMNSITSNSMKVRFKTSDNFNGMELYRYWIYISNGVSEYEVNGEAPTQEFHEVNLLELTKGQDYTVSVLVECRITKSNGQEVSLKSIRSNSLTKRPFSVPSPVLNLKSTAFSIGQDDLINTATGGKLFIEHTPPADNGGFEIHKYKVTLTNEGNDITREYFGNELIVDGLVNGATYDISVRAYTLNTNDDNSLVEGQVSSYDATSVNPSTRSQPGNIPVKIPSSVQNLVVTELDRQLKVVWDEPLDSGGTPVLKYKVDVRKTTNDSVFFSSGMLSSDIREWVTPQELTNGDVFYVKISAFNQIYSSGSTLTLTKSPYGPQYIDNISLSGKTISFRVINNGRPAQEYHIVAIDDDKMNDGSETYYLKTLVTNPEQVNNTEFSKTFSSLSGSISKYLLVVQSVSGDSIFKTTFSM